jgi:hypothetical protein
MYEFQGLVPELRPYAEALLNVLTEAGLAPTVTSTIRSTALQRRLYADYIAGRSKYPAAPPGSSAHEYGWAFDLSVNDDSYLADAGDLWESWGGTWGGRFRDPIHFEIGGATAYLHSLRGTGAAPPPIAAPEAPQEPVDEPGTLGKAVIGAAAAGNWVIDEVSGLWRWVTS